MRVFVTGATGLVGRWRSRIEAWEPGVRFVDAQLRGPYRSGYHGRRSEADGHHTIMIDRVWYSPPLGLLGRVAQRVMVGPMLRRIFGSRRNAVALRFGPDSEPAPRTDSLAA